MADRANDILKACVEMPGSEWAVFLQMVRQGRTERWRAAREAEADRLAQSMDMTPEGYVREWIRRGRSSTTPLDAWEHAYQRAGIVEQAERLGYIRIGRDVVCTISLEPRGEALVAEHATN
jgi:hypothetical protein